MLTTGILHSEEVVNWNVLAWLVVVKVDGVDSSSEHSRVKWNSFPPGLELVDVGLVNHLSVVFVDSMLFFVPLWVSNHL